MTSLTHQLIEIIEARKITDSDLQISALFLLDAAANIIAGQNSTAGRKICDWATSAGFAQAGNCKDTARLSFVYGALCHILEMDDLHRASVVHPGCVVAPVIFALGKGIDGRKGLAGFLKGVEAATRVGMAVGTEHYKIWHNTATCGPYGSAIAAAELLDMDTNSKVHALGNAGSQSAGLWQFLDSGAETKHLHAGRAAEAGVVASQLAKVGFTGAPDILEGARGFFRATCTNPPVQNLLANSNGDWQMHLNSIKPWPSCRHTHPAIAAGLALHKQLVADSRKINHIHVDTYQAALDLCDRPAPQSVYGAKFSLQHCLAVALAKGKVDLNSFDDRARTDVQELAANISLEIDDRFQTVYPDHWGCRVYVQFSNGESIEHTISDAPGDPEAALSREALIEKAAGLLNHAKVPEPNRLIDQILAMPDGGAVPDLSAYIMNFRN